MHLLFRHPKICPLLIALLIPFGVLADISILRENGKLIVNAADQLFTQYIYADKNRAKPVFYPIIGPNGNEMTRSFPFEKDKEGEEADHPHHTSLWYTHGMVNGVDFWALGEKKGKIVHEEFIEMNTEKVAGPSATDVKQNFGQLGGPPPPENIEAEVKFLQKT